MIRFLRRILVIIIIYSILLVIGNIHLTDEQSFINTLVKLGFIILSAFTLGEITSSLGITRVWGYLLSGIIFGPYLIVHTDFIPVVTEEFYGKLHLINNLAIGLIAFELAFEIDKNLVKKINKATLVNLGMNALLAIVFLFPTIFLVSVYFLNLSVLHISQIVFSVSLLSIVLINSSFEFNTILANDSTLNNTQKNFVKYATVLREVFVIILVALLFLGFAVNYGKSTQLSLSYEFLLSIGYAILFGLGLSIIGIIYTKYFKAEVLIFIITFIVIGSEACKMLDISTFVTFFTAGVIINYFGKNTEQFTPSINKISAPLIVVFFALLVSQFNIRLSYEIFIAALIISLVRILIIFISLKISNSIISLPESLGKYGWMSFSSLGSTTLLIMMFALKFDKGFNHLLELVSAIVLLNAIINPLLFKLGINKLSAFIKSDNLLEEDDEIDISSHKLTATEKKNTKFQEPNISDAKINKSLYQILFKLNTVFRNFERKFITNRSEESVELVIEVTEYYSEEFNKLKKVLINPNVSHSTVKAELLKAEESIINLYLQITESRKSVEKKILDLEPLIRDIFHSLADLTEGLQEEAKVNLDSKNFIISPDNNFRIKILKLYYKLKSKTIKLFDKEYAVTLSFPYKNLVKYYLLGESSKEILETVNLVGIERLTTLRQIKRLFDDHLANLNELMALLEEEKDNTAFVTIVYDKFEEQHKQFTNEIIHIQNEINETSNQISNRLQYALANPFNQLVSTLDNIINLNIPAIHHKFSKIFSQSEKARENALDTIRYWINYYLGYLGLFQKSATIYKLQVQLNKVINESIGVISDEINSNLADLSSLITTKITGYKQKILTPDFNLTELISSANNDLLKESISRNLYNLDYIKKSKRFNLLIEELINQFTKIANNLPQVIYMLEESDLQLLERQPKFTELKVAYISLASKELLEFKLPREIGEVNEMLINYINLTILEIKNIFSIAEYHLQTAQKELNKDNVKNELLAKEIVESLFEKLKSKIEQLNTEVHHLDHNLNKKIAIKVNLIISEINELINHGLKNNKSALIEKQTSTKALATGIYGFIYKTQKYFAELNKSIRKNYNTYFKSIIERLFSDNKSGDLSINSSAVFTNEEKLKSLPFIYRKLFDGTPLETSDFFIGRDKFIAKLKIGLNKFYENKSSSTVIVGEPGSGKRSLINTIKNIVLKDIEIIHHQFLDAITTKEELLSVFSRLLGYTKQLSVEELITELSDKTNKRIFILENIGKLFLLKLSGYEAIKLFKYIISQTQNNTFWICSAGKYPWSFFVNNFGMDELFVEKIFTNALHQKDIRTIVMSRHTATGFEITYTANELRKIKNRFIKIKSVQIEQQKLADEFFQKLEEYSEGNIISAMYYWLQSIDSVSGNTLIISPPKRISLSILETMESKYLIILSLIFKHGWISDYQVAEMLFMTIEETRNKLNYLSQLNLIYHDKLELDSDRFFINKFVFKIIETELIKRNML